LKRRFGRVSAPVPATHCQLPLLAVVEHEQRHDLAALAPRGGEGGVVVGAQVAREEHDARSRHPSRSSRRRDR
jgi:hypothetical protein